MIVSEIRITWRRTHVITTTLELPPQAALDPDSGNRLREQVGVRVHQMAPTSREHPDRAGGRAVAVERISDRGSHRRGDREGDDARDQACGDQTRGRSVTDALDAAEARDQH